MVTKYSFCHTISFNKNGSLVSSRARFLVRPYVVRSDPESRNVCVSVCVLSHFTDEDFNCLYLSQLLMDFGQILDSKSYDQVCKNASMPVCQFARMQVYTCLYKKLNKNLAREDTRLPFLLKELLWRNEHFVTKWFQIYWSTRHFHHKCIFLNNYC